MDAVGLRDFLYWLAREKGIGTAAILHVGAPRDSSPFLGAPTVASVEVLPLANADLEKFVHDYMSDHPMGILTDVRDCRSLDDIRRWMATHPDHLFITPFREIFEDAELGDEEPELIQFMAEAGRQVEKNGGYYD